MAGLGGVMGLDLPALLQIADALGYDHTPLVLLLPYVEAGLRAATKTDEDDGGNAQSLD